ncbi:MAG TPA: hypothetical protein VIJ64_06430 [Candidatus Lustribacter sp.]
MNSAAFWLFSGIWFAGLVAFGMYQSRAFELRARWLQRCGMLLFASGGLLAAYFHTGWQANASVFGAVLGVIAITMAKRWSDRLKRGS